MAFRKNGKIFPAAAACSALMLLSGCAVNLMEEQGGSIVNVFGSHSSYYNNFTAGTEDGGYRIQGTASFGSDTENSIVRMSAEEEQTAMVEGTLDCKKGSLRLVYTAADGTETVLAECEDASYEAFDVGLTVTDEESVLKLSGNGDDEVCDFEIFIVGDGIRFNLGRGGKGDAEETAEFIEDVEMPEIPEIPDVPGIPRASEIMETTENTGELKQLDDMESLSFPIIDNWPESVSCTADGLTAKPLSFELPVEKAMTLSLSCVTEEGGLRIQLKDSDGKIVFDEKKIRMEDFKISIDTPDTYTVSVWAEQFYGKFEILPESVAE